MASEHGLSVYEALGSEIHQVPGAGKAAQKNRVYFQMEWVRAMAQSEEYSIKDLIQAILEETGYKNELEAEGGG